MFSELVSEVTQCLLHAISYKSLIAVQIQGQRTQTPVLEGKNVKNFIVMFYNHHSYPMNLKKMWIKQNTTIVNWWSHIYLEFLPWQNTYTNHTGLNIVHLVGREKEFLRKKKVDCGPIFRNECSHLKTKKENCTMNLKNYEEWCSNSHWVNLKY